MKILVDADACPVVIKDILFRITERTKIELVLIANHFIKTPYNVKFIQVGSGFDVADDEIVLLVESGDLVITSDLPLAFDALNKKAQVLSPRGELYTQDNIKARLNIRDFMDTMRSSGMHTGGPAPLNNQDKQVFANAIDKIVTKYLNSKKE